MSTTREGGSSPEQALKLYLKAFTAADLDSALELLTGPQEATWRRKVAKAPSLDDARADFKRWTKPTTLEAVLDREDLVGGSVRIHARVRVERNGETVKDTVTPTFDRDADGLWRIASF